MTGEERALAETLHSLLAELIAIPSATPPGDTRAICEAGAEHLKAAGYEVSMPMRTAPIANLVARLGEGSPCVVFNAHIDTVGTGTGDRAAWREGSPFAATMEKGRIIDGWCSAPTTASGSDPPARCMICWRRATRRRGLVSSREPNVVCTALDRRLLEKGRHGRLRSYSVLGREQLQGALDARVRDLARPPNAA